MKKYTIKNRYTDKIIAEMEAESLKEVVVKNKANLQEADIWGANLWGAKIKTTQAKNLLNAMGIIVENLKSN